MTYRKYFDSHDPNGPQQFFNSIAGQATSRTMGRDEKGAFVEYSVGADHGQCVNHHDSERCPNPAQVQMLDPEGERVPGCRYCESCAIATISEYASKLDEGWSALFLDSAGFIDIGRLPVLPLAIALVAGYAIHFIVAHGIFASLSILAR